MTHKHQVLFLFISPNSHSLLFISTLKGWMVRFTMHIYRFEVLSFVLHIFPLMPNLETHVMQPLDGRQKKEKDEMTVHRRWHIHKNVWCTLLEGILSYPFTSFLIHLFVMVDAMPVVCEILRDKFRSCCNTIYTFLVKTNNGAGFLSNMSPSFPACSWNSPSNWQQVFDIDRV